MQWVDLDEVMSPYRDRTGRRVDHATEESFNKMPALIQVEIGRYANMRIHQPAQGYKGRAGAMWNLAAQAIERFISEDESREDMVKGAIEWAGEELAASRPLPYRQAHQSEILDV